MYSLASPFTAHITSLRCFNMFAIYSNTHILLKEEERQIKMTKLIAYIFFHNLIQSE